MKRQVVPEVLLNGLEGLLGRIPVVLKQGREGFAEFNKTVSERVGYFEFVPDFLRDIGHIADIIKKTEVEQGAAQRKQ